MNDTPWLDVLINPMAGPDRPVLRLLSQGFARAGAGWTAHVTQGPGDGSRIVREILARGARRLAVCGGDGSLREIVGLLAGTGVEVGILPAGTGNALALELGLPTDLSAAAELVARRPAHTRDIDLARIGEHVFVLRASLGLEPDLLRHTGQELKNQLGGLAYPLTALQRLGQAPLADYRLTIDGAEHQATGVLCTIANSAQMGVTGWSLAGGVAVDDGRLDAIVVGALDWPALADLVASNLLGERDGVEIRHWQGQTITVDAEPSQDIALGGELVARTPATITVLPGALRVVVPAPGRRPVE